MKFIDALNLKTPMEFFCGECPHTDEGRLADLWVSSDGSWAEIMDSRLQPSTDSELSFVLIEIPMVASGGEEIADWLSTHSDKISEVLEEKIKKPYPLAMALNALQAEFRDWACDRLPYWITPAELWEGVDILKDFFESGLSQVDYPGASRNDTIHHILSGESAVAEYLQECLDEAFPIEKPYNELRESGFEIDDVESHDSLLSLEWDGTVNMWSREVDEWVELTKIPSEVLEYHRRSLLSIAYLGEQEI